MRKNIYRHNFRTKRIIKSKKVVNNKIYKKLHTTLNCVYKKKKNSKQYCYFFFFLVQYNQYEEKGGNQNETKNAIWNKQIRKNSK